MFKFKDLGWFDALPPDPLVVGVHLPGEVVKYTEVVFWKRAKQTGAVGQHPLRIQVGVTTDLSICHGIVMITVFRHIG